MSLCPRPADRSIHDRPGAWGRLRRRMEHSTLVLRSNCITHVVGAMRLTSTRWAGTRRGGVETETGHGVHILTLHGAAWQPIHRVSVLVANWPTSVDPEMSMHKHYCLYVRGHRLADCGCWCLPARLLDHDVIVGVRSCLRVRVHYSVRLIMTAHDGVTVNNVRLSGRIGGAVNKAKPRVEGAWSGGAESYTPTAPTVCAPCAVGDQESDIIGTCEGRDWRMVHGAWCTWWCRRMHVVGVCCACDVESRPPLT